MGVHDLVLENLKLVGHVGEYNIGINEGKISEISKTNLQGDKVIRFCDGEIALPGLIDPHVHFRDPGLTYKEDFHTGSMSAANGGFTTIIDMPNTVPVSDTYKSFKDKKKIGEKKSLVNFGLNAGFNSLNDMREVAKLHPCSFKIFMDLKSDLELNECFYDLSLLNSEGYDFMVSCHCENKFIIRENTYWQQSKEFNESIDYSLARPSEAEIVSVKQALDLADKYNLKTHICHLSTVDGLKSVKNSNVDVSYEFTPHHLLLDNAAFNVYGNMVKTNPPLRPLSEGVSVKDISSDCMIGTDHAPHSLEEKSQGVWDSKPGIPNLETVLPLLLTEVNKGNIPLSFIPKIMSENIAKRFRLTNKGCVKVGFDADLTIINLGVVGKLDLNDFYTKGKYTPFKNWEYSGKAVMTIVKGNVVMENGVIIENSRSDIPSSVKGSNKYVYD